MSFGNILRGQPSSHSIAEQSMVPSVQHHSRGCQGKGLDTHSASPRELLDGEGGIWDLCDTTQAENFRGDFLYLADLI